jgi:hypothetical protein
MNDLTCPWCESGLEQLASQEQQCPECLTTWTYEEEPEELGLAA